MHRFVYAGALAACLTMSGCATNTMTGRSQYLLVSEESAIRSSASAYSSMIGGFWKKGKVETGTPRAERVREITNKLISQAVRFRPDSAAWKWEVQVINEPKTVNAFCMAGGKMAIYTGFWERLNATDDEVAAVMGHEIGHALASHTREKMSVGLTSSIGATLLAALVSRNNPQGFRGNNENLQALASLAVTLPNSREAEVEADQIGIELAARAGFDPRAAVTLWQRMQGRERGYVPEFLSTHPAHDTRIQNLSALVPQVDHLYQLAKAGKSTEGVPAFVGAAAKGNLEERKDFAARAAAEPDAMTFIAAEFERFKRGEVVFDCGFGCAFSYGWNRGGWKELHAKRAWRDLAISVMKVGYKNDLSYFFLAEAAAGLRLGDAARTYYARALEAQTTGNGCADGLGNTCEGFDVQALANAALKPR